MTPSFAPSSSTSALRYDVFVSFCREDTHTSFTCHLFAALDRKKICACRGEFNRTELMKAIETSRMSVVVFSKSYATSDRCIDELAKIMECNRVLNQRVLPIFYDVSPSEVRKQKGNFEEAANLAGFHLKANRPESDFIEEIVEKILKELKKESSNAPSLRQNDAPSLKTSALRYERFCGDSREDTRTRFTCHLFATLDCKKICAFIGEFNQTKLMKTIETSRMAVFSKSYATSDQCRDELAKIMESNRVLNQRVLPIFYGVKSPDSESIVKIVENILKELNEESSTAPSLHQNDAPAQHSSATIPHNDASSGQNTTTYAFDAIVKHFYSDGGEIFTRACPY